MKWNIIKNEWIVKKRKLKYFNVFTPGLTKKNIFYGSMSFQPIWKRIADPDRAWSGGVGKKYEMEYLKKWMNCQKKGNSKISTFSYLVWQRKIFFTAAWVSNRFKNGLQILIEHGSEGEEKNKKWNISKNDKII